MCGIQGFFSQSGEGNEGLVERMGATIRHRGPDDCGSFYGPGVGIGNMRLSIIDLAGGHQPMVSECGEVVIVQNGEIYNYIELRDELKAKGHAFTTGSDTEVVLRLYMEHGTDCLNRMVGMFGTAIWDGRSRELHLFRDALGVKPLFTWFQEGQLYFGSEIKAILAAGVPRRMSSEALHHFLSYGYVPPPLTLFEGVRHLMPGYRMVISGHMVETIQWWDPTAIEQREVGLDDFKAEFLQRLGESVRLRMRADVPFGAFLSGGLDSSTVVGLMREHTDHPVKTFSIGFHDERFDESLWGKMASDRFGTDHMLEFVGPEIVEKWSTTIYHCDQPHSDVSFLPTLRLSELAVGHVKMVLTGDGGDELFGGYTKYSGFFERHGVEMAESDFCRLYHDHISLFNEEDKKGLYSSRQRRESGGLDTGAMTLAWVQRVPHWDRINQALWLDIGLLLPGNNLVKPDRMAMAVSLEARDPFLDKGLAEFAMSVPGSMKVRGDVTRYGYKKSVEGLLGPELTYRAKRMFTVPIGEWFKDVLKDFTKSVLHSDRFLDRGLFDREVVNQMVFDHENEVQDHTREIRLLLALEMWHRIFLDREDLSAPSMHDVAAEIAVS